MNGSDLLWRIIQGELVIVLGLAGILLFLLIWWLLRKLVAVLTLSVAVDQTEYFRGDTVQISGSLLDGTSPVEGATVSLAIQPPTGDAYSLPSVTTIADGSFAAPWNVPSDAEAGSYVITATSSGASDTAAFTLESH